MAYTGILVLVDNNIDGSLNQLTKELLYKARELADELDEKVITLSIGADMKKTAQETSLYGADICIYINHPVLEKYTTLPYTKAVDMIIEKYNPRAVLISSDSDGRDLAGRLCAKREIGLVADCSDIELTEDKKDIKWIRPSFDGKLFSDIRIKSNPKIGTVSSGVFRPAKKDFGSYGKIIEEKIEFTEDELLTQVIDLIKKPKEERSLTNCDIIVSGGMGIGSKENWKLIEDLASALNAITGATKPVCDMGWVAADKQIGSTGKRVAPKLYIAIGISGAIQHVAGIKKSDLIIAINKDSEAPIFKYSHYGIIGDLFEVVPILTEKIKALK